MKVIETTAPVERSFQLTVTENELKVIQSAVGGYKHGDDLKRKFGVDIHCLFTAIMHHIGYDLNDWKPV